MSDNGLGFEYHEPETLDEALDVLEREGEGGAALAGGTDLLLRMRRGIQSYRSVINIKRIAVLNEVQRTPSGVSIGALTTFRALETDADLGGRFPALRDAARVIAGVQLRNLATVGGNIGNASPAADSIPPLVALGASVTVASKGHSWSMPVEESIAGPGRTVLTPGQIFMSIHIPQPKQGSGNAFLRFSPRSAMDIGIVSVASSITLDSEGRCAECRIALGAVSARPMRATTAEAAVTGQPFGSHLAERAGILAAQEAQPIDDIRGSADYRRAIVRVLTRRTLEQAADLAGRSGHRS